MKKKILVGICCLMLAGGTILATTQASAADSGEFEPGYLAAGATTTGSSSILTMIPSIIAAVKASLQ